MNAIDDDVETDSMAVVEEAVENIFHWVDSLAALTEYGIENLYKEGDVMTQHGISLDEFRELITEDADMIYGDVPQEKENGRLLCGRYGPYLKWWHRPDYCVYSPGKIREYIVRTLTFSNKCCGGCDGAPVLKLMKKLLGDGQDQPGSFPIDLVHTVPGHGENMTMEQFRQTVRAHEIKAAEVLACDVLKDEDSGTKARKTRFLYGLVNAPIKIRNYGFKSRQIQHLGIPLRFVTTPLKKNGRLSLFDAAAKSLGALGITGDLPAIRKVLPRPVCDRFAIDDKHRTFKQPFVSEEARVQYAHIVYARNLPVC